MEARVNDNNKSRDARTKKYAIEIDMNPMVDLAFLLLTFFMLTTTFSKPQTMEITMPVKPKSEDIEKEQPVKESKTITVILKGGDKIYWYHGITDPIVKLTDYSSTGVRRTLLQKNAEISDLVVLIKPDDDSNYENLVDILDEMNITGVERYAIVDITNQDKKLIAGYEL